ncbi:MAG: STAS domain-containing protein [Ruminococcaceae bacterium]|nr:STAS domain-containing protein [Oscillospiraceae bacterium]
MPNVIRKENGVMTVKITGDIDHHTCKDLRNEIDSILLCESPECMLFDLTECDFMDSSGLGLILGRFRKCTENGCEFKIVNPSGKTLKILRMAGVDKLIKVESIEI